MLAPVKPMLASPPKAERIERLGGQWAYDLKLDGLRAIAYWDGSNLTLLNRSMKDITHQFPELEATAPCLGDPCVIDGEIVALSGDFSDVATRGKQNKPGDIARAMAAAPCTFIAFDVLYCQGYDRRNYPFETRRLALDVLAPWDTADHWSTSVISDDPGFFDTVKAAGMEGVIAKRKRSTYRSGRFSDWIKFKAVRSLTCVMVGYEPGIGARAHFGAAFLALVGPQGVVNIGRVGTGFDAKEINYLKSEMDAGRMPIVEIECLNVSRKDEQLRFPVYKGVRSDLSVADARLSQLDDIPRC